jgi:hypothetical protein
LSLCKQHELNSSNIRHLAGLLDGKDRPAHVKGWRLLDTVKWIRRETDGLLVPVPHEVPGFCACMRFQSAPVIMADFINDSLLYTACASPGWMGGVWFRRLPMPWATSYACRQQRWKAIPPRQHLPLLVAPALARSQSWLAPLRFCTACGHCRPRRTRS